MLVGFDFDELLRGAGAEEAAHLLGCDVERLLRSSPVRIRSPRRFKLFNEVFQCKQVRRLTRRWCSYCMQEDTARSAGQAYHRSEWEILALTCCAQHGVRLNNACHSCLEPVTWRSGNLTVCQCGADLRNTPMPESLNDGARAFECYLRRRISGEKTGSWLDAQPLYSLIAFVEALGIAASHERRGRRPALKAEEQAIAREIGFGFVVNASEGLLRCYDKLLGGRTYPCGLTEAYGWLYGWLSSRRSDKLVRFAITILSKHARRYQLIEQTDCLLTGKKTDAVSMEQASKMLGLGNLSTRALLVERNLLPKSRRRGLAYKIPTQAIRKLVDELAECVDMLGLSTLLAVERPNELVATGVLAPSIGKACGAKKLFNRVEVEAFLKRLQGRGLPETHPAWLPLPDACKCKQVSLRRTIEAIIAGQVPSKRIVGQGLRGVGIRLEDLQSLRKNR